jgi:hypothetical protein
MSATSTSPARSEYVVYYCAVRLHSAIGYVTPKDKLEGRDKQIIEERDRKLVEARNRRQELRRTRHEQLATQPQVVARPAIDFDALRSLISIKAVVELLNWQPNSNAQGTQQRGPCPLHGSSSRTSRCFSINLDRNIFQCFKCARSGNALDLWTHASKKTPYDAAIELCERLNIPLPTLPPTTGAEKRNP